jgi:hypothetical protein
MVISASQALQLTIILVILLTLIGPQAFSASFVLGKQYLLRQKRQNTSLVWYAVTFDRSLMGGLKVDLKVYSEKGKSLEYLDDYRNFVAPEIAERCISKFSLTAYKMDFDEKKKSSLGFQIKTAGEVIYIPLKVTYENGFEDYLLRVRIKDGKFAISARPLQQGMLSIPDPNAVENYRAEREKQKQDELKKQEQQRLQAEKEKKEEEARLKALEEFNKKPAPNVLINEELFGTSDDKVDKILKESESEFSKKESEALKTINPDNQVFDPSPNGSTNNSNDESMDVKDDMEEGVSSGNKTSSPMPMAPSNESDSSGKELESLLQNEFNPSNSDQASPLKPEVKNQSKVESKFEDTELEIEGFDKALEEIERLEKLEK